MKMEFLGDEHVVRSITLHAVPAGLLLKLRTLITDMTFQTELSQCQDGNGGWVEMLRIVAGVQDGICPVFQVLLVAQTQEDRMTLLDAVVHTRSQNSSTGTEASLMVTSGSVLQIYTDVEPMASFYQPVRM